MTLKLRALIYARVSTTDKGQDPEMQLREMRDFTGHAGWEHMELVDLVSSRRDHRPALEKLWEMCRRRQVDVVVVYRFDRFARSSRQLFNALEEFRQLGIQFVSLHERIDTTTAQGMLMFSIFAAFAEFERNLIAERVRSGLANAQAKGKRLGRPRLVPDVDYIGRVGPRMRTGRRSRTR